MSNKDNKNLITITGNLGGKDDYPVEVQEYGAGRDALVKFNIAHNKFIPTKKRDQHGKIIFEKRVTWFDVAVWTQNKKLADALNKLENGTMLEIEGEFKLNTYQKELVQEVTLLDGSRVKAKVVQTCARAEIVLQGEIPADGTNPGRAATGRITIIPRKVKTAYELAQEAEIRRKEKKMWDGDKFWHGKGRDEYEYPYDEEAPLTRPAEMLKPLAKPSINRETTIAIGVSAVGKDKTDLEGLEAERQAHQAEAVALGQTRKAAVLERQAAKLGQVGAAVKEVSQLVEAEEAEQTRLKKLSATRLRKLVDELSTKPKLSPQEQLTLRMARFVQMTRDYGLSEEEALARLEVITNRDEAARKRAKKVS
jgi:hypothetical protein